jgi:hypothetical protein
MITGAQAIANGGDCDPLQSEITRSRVHRRHCAAGVLSATLPMYYLRGADSDFVVLCIAKREDADAFCQRCNGQRVPVPRRRGNLFHCLALPDVTSTESNMANRDSGHRHVRRRS